MCSRSAPAGGRSRWSAALAGENETVPVRIWDAADNSLRTIIPDKNVMAECVLSNDGRWMVIGIGAADRDGNVERLRIVNLATGTADDWTGPDEWPKYFSLSSFSPDGRWLAFAERDLRYNEPGVRLWDLANRRPAALLPDLFAWAVFSADGQRVAGSVHSQTRRNEFDDVFAVYDTASGRELARWDGERAFEIDALTPSGSGLIAYWTGTDPVLRALVTQIKCWSVADRHERWSIDTVVDRRPVEGGRRFAIQRQDYSAGLNEVIIIDAEDGRTLFRRPLRKGENLRDASPDGRTLLT